MDKIFDGRLLFICSKCSICAVVPKDADADSPDSAYLEFLELYDNGLVTESDDQSDNVAGKNPKTLIGNQDLVRKDKRRYNKQVTQ